VNARGQALIEWAVIVPLFMLLFLGLYAFAQWFLIRQQLIMVVREGAFLYSSGRIPKDKVISVMHLAFQKGHPGLNIPTSNIYVGQSSDSQAFRYQLDRIAVKYHPTQPILRLFPQDMEESCTIKHAPSYWEIMSVLKSGPPVKW